MDNKPKNAGANLVPEMQVKPVLVLDFDGTIRRNKFDHKSFINKESEIELMPGIEERIWAYRDKGYLIAGATNQGGVAFGYKLPPDVDSEIKHTIELFDRNPFHYIKACLHHEKGNVEPFCHRSLIRKPNYGMLVLAEAELFNYGYVVDWDRSIFVGDSDDDRLCAEAAGIEFIHIEEFLL